MARLEGRDIVKDCSSYSSLSCGINWFKKPESGRPFEGVSRVQGKYNSLVYWYVSRLREVIAVCSAMLLAITEYPTLSRQFP